MQFKHSRITHRHDGNIVFVDVLTLLPRPSEVVTVGRAQAAEAYTMSVEVPEGGLPIRMFKRADASILHDAYEISMRLSREDLKGILEAVKWADAGPLGRLALEAKPTREFEPLS